MFLKYLFLYFVTILRQFCFLLILPQRVKSPHVAYGLVVSKLRFVIINYEKPSTCPTLTPPSPLRWKNATIYLLYYRHATTF